MRRVFKRTVRMALSRQCPAARPCFDKRLIPVAHGALVSSLPVRCGEACPGARQEGVPWP